MAQLHPQSPQQDEISFVRLHSYDCLWPELSHAIKTIATRNIPDRSTPRNTLGGRKSEPTAVAIIATTFIALIGISRKLKQWITRTIFTTI